MFYLLIFKNKHNKESINSVTIKIKKRVIFSLNSRLTILVIANESIKDIHTHNECKTANLLKALSLIVK